MESDADAVGGTRGTSASAVLFLAFLDARLGTEDDLLGVDGESRGFDCSLEGVLELRGGLRRLVLSSGDAASCPDEAEGAL